jgi:hypothetical protein
MKYNIHYKATDRVVDNPVENVEESEQVPLKVKQLMIPVMNKFKKLGYEFKTARLIEKTENDQFLNNMFVDLLNNSFVEIKFLIYYNATKDSIVKAFIYKQDKTFNKYSSFTKEELKLVDAYDFMLPTPFIEETEQQATDWLYMT